MTPLAERLEAALLITRTAARRFGDDALTTSGWKPHPTRMEMPSTIAPGLNSVTIQPLRISGNTSTATGN